MDKQKPPTQSPERTLIWVRRMIAVLLVSLTLIGILAFNGYHTGWVGVVASFTFAEFTRRIMAEQNPERAMGWIAILRYGFGGGEEPCKPCDKEGKQR